MTQMLIGSRAMAFWTGDEVNPGTDYDIIHPTKNGKEGDIEYSSYDVLNNQRAVELFCTPSISIEVNGEEVNLCSVAGLMMIKRSHLHRDLAFDKHMIHYIEMVNRMDRLHQDFGKGGKFVPSESARDFLRERTELTKQKYPQSSPSLMKTNEDFFDDAVTKHFVHDDLHELMAHEDEPMYVKMKVNKDMAKCEKHLWEAFSYLQKVQCVMEEVYVISLERFLIPARLKGESFPTRLAMLKALRKVCTTLTSGWFRDFAIDNFETIRTSLCPEVPESFFNSELWRSHA